MQLIKSILTFFSIILIATVSHVQAAQLGRKVPNCTGTEQWPASMAQVQLNNAHITQTEKLDLSKTKVDRLANEAKGSGIFTQVHRIVFHEKSGTAIEVITINDATQEECSASEVTVYVINKTLGKR